MSMEEAIPVHKQRWTKRELLSRVISRHMHVLEDAGGRIPTYVVAEKEDGDIHEDLLNLNAHLSKHGFSARLYPDEPWIIQLIPDPEFQWPSPRFTAVMWLIALVTTVYAGEKWMASGRPDGGWFVSNASLDALIGYSLPILGVVIISSFVQKRVAAKHGVHMPHLFPIAGPAMVWWPFGIIGVASLPRSDARLWPDRSSMGNTAISSPLVMIISGMILAAIGIKITPDVVALTSSPMMIELPLLLNLIGMSFEGETAMFLKTAWAHPFTRAGMTLSFMGWIALLPIPTFPGGRVLIARMGIPEARSGSTQVMLLLVVMLFAFLFGAFSAWSVWVPVVALCAIMLISRGSDPRMPVVLDDMKGLHESDHRSLGMILFLAFMFALPSQVPFVVPEDYQPDLEFEFDYDTLTITPGLNEIILEVTNPSLVVQSWHFGAFGPDGAEALSLDCGNGESIEHLSCEGDIAPLESDKIKFSFYWNTTWMKSSMQFWYRVNDDFISHEIKPNSTLYPVGSWIFNGDLSDPKSCIETFHGIGGEITLSPISESTWWSGVNESGNISLAGGLDQICINGQSGDDLSWLQSFEFTLGENQFRADYDSGIEKIPIPANGVELTESDLMFERTVLAANHEGHCLSVMDYSPPMTVEGEDRIWDMSVTTTARNDATIDNPITLLAPEGTLITSCDESMQPELVEVVEGPLLMVEEDGEMTQRWLGSISLNSGNFMIENMGQTDLTLYVEFGGNGPQWDVSTSHNLLAGEMNDISATAPETGNSYSWLELDEDRIVLHLTNHEV